MNTTDPRLTPTAPAAPKSLVIKVFGVGNGGAKLLSTLKSRDVQGINLIAVNTELTALPDGVTMIHAENKLLRGLGTGGDPDRGRAAAEEAQSRFRSLCEGADVVLLLSTFGGGAGTGMTPVLAKVAKETGALVLGFITTPFDCEGRRRQNIALEGLEMLRPVADGVICMPNQRVFKLVDENTALLETFSRTNDLVADAVIGLSRLLTKKGLLEIRFEELASVVREAKGDSACATIETSGPTRAADALERLIGHPMLDDGELLKDAESLLISLIAGNGLTMAEVNRVMSGLQSKCPEAHVVMGASIDESFDSKLAVTLIVRRKGDEPKGVDQPRYSRSGEEFHAHLLNDAKTPKSGSRFVPPPPEVSAQDLEKLAGRQKGSAKPKKAAPRMRQGQLPLEIVSKGRFDKSEPTIHRGEDLDVPTYIRRGVALN